MPTCQKSLWPSAAHGCPAPAEYMIITAPFAGVPGIWFGACARHAHLAIAFGRAEAFKHLSEWGLELAAS